jgi:hypothetical protein
MPAIVLPVPWADAADYVAAFPEDGELGRLLGIERDPDVEGFAERVALRAEGRLAELAMTTTPDNAAVPAFSVSLGSPREGVLRGRNLERGQRVDVVMFGLLRHEWREAQSSLD